MMRAAVMISSDPPMADGDSSVLLPPLRSA
jgi:hypothetical protein